MYLTLYIFLTVLIFATVVVVIIMTEDRIYYRHRWQKKWYIQKKKSGNYVWRLYNKWASRGK